MENDHDWNDETIKEIHSDRKNEKQAEDFIQIDDDVESSENEDCEVSHKSTVNHDKNDQTMKDISIRRNTSIGSKSKRQQNWDSQIYEENHTTFNNRYKDYNCKSCSKLFTSTSYLKKHIHTIHKGHKDYKCKFCGKLFSQPSTLKRHINDVHNGQKDHKCESCGKSFSQAGSLKTHIHKLHGIESYNGSLYHIKKIHAVKSPNRKFFIFAIIVFFSNSSAKKDTTFISSFQAFLCKLLGI